MGRCRKEQGQFHTRPNIALRLAAILLMLVCLSVWLMNGLFAKYRTSDEGGDNARVISFGALNIYEEGNFISGPAPIIPGVDLIKDVTISFTGSESSTYIFVEVSLPGEPGETLPRWTRVVGAGGKGDVYTTLAGRVSWKVAEEWTFLLQETGEPTCIYYCELEPNETFSKKFIADKDGKATGDGVITVDKTIIRSDMALVKAYTQPIEIDLRAVVVQSNGFANPTEAWASVSGKLD